MKSSTVPMAVLVVILVLFVFEHETVRGMSTEARNKARVKVLEMFNHAYKGYMKNAYPADELMPLSCKGRYRGSEPSRGDVDDSLGNFSLSLIDSLDTLAVLGEIEEFEKAVKLVIANTKFDTDVIVSVFETNIRVVGGLLGGHVMAVYLKKKKFAMEWYKDELLNMAKDIGTRLLPSFNTTTGIPYPRINLRSGINSYIEHNYKDTCTACAGTMVLEFAALSRFTGDPVFEEKAHKAMDFLWNQRHRSSDLVGTVINIHNGDWIRRESGVGAGIDSYYEYVLKAYVLLGDDSYLTRFNRHYEAVMKYVSQGPLFMDVHMHRPLTASKNFMDALLAFWPGLQVLKGDIPPAIEMHEMLYQVMQRHNFLPEAFTTDFHVHWAHHPLRPEFVESTYFLYKATGDPYYLEVGQKVIDNLEAHARVPCGYAAIKDVTKVTKEDQMDSFVLAETFKYLYLLFADKSEMMLDMDDYIFTTEGHLLPLSLSRCNTSRTPANRLSREMYTHLREIEEASHIEDEYGDSIHNTCPNPKIRYKQSVNYAQNLRTNLVITPTGNRAAQRQEKQCQPTGQNVRSNRLKASQFVAGNKEHLQQLKDMGIHLATMSDGRIQLLHTAAEAISPQMAEEGFVFMQEMIDLSKSQPADASNEPMVIQILTPPFQNEMFRAGPAQFGYDLKSRPPIRGQLEIAKPFKACSPIQNLYHVKGKIAIIERGDCMFVDKTRQLQKAGAIGAICLDHTEGSSVDTQPLFAMSGDGTNDVTIPLVFLFKVEGDKLLTLLDEEPSLIVKLSARLQVVGSVVEPSGPGQNGDEVDERLEEDKAEFEPSLPTSYLKKQGQSDDVISFQQLPDGSQQIFFRFDSLQNHKAGTTPDLSEVYQSIVKTLLDKTNFSKLDKQSEYLTAIAKLLESAYSSTRNVDSRVQEMFQELTNELEVLSEEELMEEQNLNRVDSTSKEEFGTVRKTDEISSTDEMIQTYNMEGVTITVKTSSDKSTGKVPDSTGSHPQQGHATSGDNYESYAGLADFDAEESTVSMTEMERVTKQRRTDTVKNLYSSVWTRKDEIDVSDIDNDEDFKHLEAINSDLAQKLKRGIALNREQIPKQPKVSVKIVKVDLSGSGGNGNEPETVIVESVEDAEHDSIEYNVKDTLHVSIEQSEKDSVGDFIIEQSAHNTGETQSSSKSTTGAGDVSSDGAVNNDDKETTEMSRDSRKNKEDL